MSDESEENARQGQEYDVSSLTFYFAEPHLLIHLTHSLTHSNRYANASEFRSDFALICSNAVMYNPYDTFPYKTALKFYETGKTHIETFLKITEINDVENELLKLIEKHRDKNVRVKERRKRLALSAQEQNKSKELRLVKSVPYQKLNMRVRDSLSLYLSLSALNRENIALCLSHLRTHPHPSTHSIDTKIQIPNSVIRFSESQVKLCLASNCDVCSSFGMPEYFVTCLDCGISRHTFCAHIPISSRKRRTQWRCESCATCCELCGNQECDYFYDDGMNNKMLSSQTAVRCSGCQGMFHAGCLDPPMLSVEDSRRWFCTLCIDCESCNRKSQSWSLRIDSCSRCDNQIKSNKDLCIVCREDTGLLYPFVQCDGCDSWLHVKCTNMTSNQVQLLTHPDASYLCDQCVHIWNHRLTPLLQSIDTLRDEKTSNWQVSRRRFLRRKHVQHLYASSLYDNDDSRSKLSSSSSFGHSYKHLQTIFEHRDFDSSLPIWSQRSIVHEQVLCSSLPITTTTTTKLSDEKNDDNNDDEKTRPSSPPTFVSHQITDTRQCIMCFKQGDRDNHCEGRLLVAPIISEYTEWIHVNCALWASECHEDKTGVIRLVAKAISRGQGMKCSLCFRKGGVVGCCYPLCKNTYHIECAIESGCFLNATVYCEKHRKDNETAKFVLDGAVPRSLVCSTKGAKKKPVSKIPRLLRLDSLTIHRYGEISCDPRGGRFHDKNFIYPCGFVSTRIYWSLDGSNRTCLYTCRVVRVQRRAKFIISNSNDDSTVIQANSADEAVKLFYIKLYEGRANTTDKTSRRVVSPPPDQQLRSNVSYHGAYFMGFGVMQVVEVIENLPGAVQLALPKSMRSGIELVLSSSTSSSSSWPEYHFHTRDPNKDEIANAFKFDQALAKEFSERVTNASGCARCEPYRANAKRHNLSGLDDDDDGATTTTMPKMILVSSDLGMSSNHISKNNNISKNKLRRNSTMKRGSKNDYAFKYLELKSIPWEERVCVRRSRIHGWGIFVRKDFKKGDMIVEFTGEIIRSVVADRREKMYEASGMIGCYMFRLNKEYIIDGTKKGNITRFTNHSCDPNAYVKVIDVRQGLNKDERPGPQNEKIVFFAKKDMPRGTELLYDYQYALEDDKEVLCNCQSINCKGRMN